MLYPGHAAERDFPLVESALHGAARLPVVITDVESDDHTVAAMRAVGTDRPLLDGARRATAYAPDALMWACTSGSFLYGWDGAHAQVQRLSTATGLPVSSTSLAFADACRALDIDTVTVAATYPAPVADGFATFLADAGVAVLETVSHGIETATEAGILDGDQLFSMVSSANHTEAQAILVPDTALHTIGWLTDLEREVGKPVLTANQVTVWQALRLVDQPTITEGLGTLFSARIGSPSPPR
ncbi:maleate cis-trans isomerase [Gordonia sp. CPCC 206044]|uniref:maleate cis-trans isomerase family protein n=1 Tax=Gordonia sp. CPCC 206044 TaxID=3140793 RepID=UPI003AF3EC32